jgi:AmpD protein
MSHCSWQDGGWLEGIKHLHSPHHNERPSNSEISLLVIHYISLPPNQFGGPDIEKLFTGQLDTQSRPEYAELEGLEVSAHFLIRRDGALLQFVGCDQRAWHAGASRWQDRENCNDFSIGIELEGCETIPFKEAQYETLIALCEQLGQRYPIRDIAGHCHVAPGRKTDPGPMFQWQRLKQALPQFRVEALTP